MLKTETSDNASEVVSRGTVGVGNPMMMQTLKTAWIDEFVGDEERFVA